ncbi:MAG: hypothetical protein PHG97_07720 [Candidatus Margulisbacteria bacterium]|nr:hypothetical protein [Candidatus Margulisiibacteriota bacterium]
MGYKPLIIVVLLASQSFAQTAFDPLSIAIGARPLGMGGAFVAVADDGNTLFNNPAGLGEIDSVKFTSMSGALLEDVNYTVLGGILPFGNQFSLGAGYAGAFVSGLEIRDARGNLGGSANYGNSTAFIALGKKLNDRSSLGLSLKYYFASASERSSGNGWNIDAGLLQSGWNWLKLGLVGRNLIGTSRINYQNGQSEPLPFSIRAGTKIYLLGNGFDAAIGSPWETNLVADADFFPQGSTPMSLHTGLEFSPSPFLAVRAGVDRSNLTGGLSLKIAGFGFHYAYHPYGDFDGSAANYFSITYDERGFPPEPPAPDTYIAKYSSL